MKLHSSVWHSGLQPPCLKLLWVGKMVPMVRWFRFAYPGPPYLCAFVHAVPPPPSTWEFSTHPSRLLSYASPCSSQEPSPGTKQRNQQQALGGKQEGRSRLRNPPDSRVAHLQHLPNQAASGPEMHGPRKTQAGPPPPLGASQVAPGDPLLHASAFPSIKWA